MPTIKIRGLVPVLAATCGISALIAVGQAQKQNATFSPTIPKTWTQAEIAD